jgi:hypothetical protein
MIWVRLLRAKASSLKQILKKAAPKGRLFLLPDRPERRWESAFWKKEGIFRLLCLRRKNLME